MILQLCRPVFDVFDEILLFPVTTDIDAEPQLISQVSPSDPAVVVTIGIAILVILVSTAREAKLSIEADQSRPTRVP